MESTQVRQQPHQSNEEAVVVATLQDRHLDHVENCRDTLGDHWTMGKTGEEHSHIRNDNLFSLSSKCGRLIHAGEQLHSGLR